MPQLLSRFDRKVRKRVKEKHKTDRTKEKVEGWIKAYRVSELVLPGQLSEQRGKESEVITKKRRNERRNGRVEHEGHFHGLGTMVIFAFLAYLIKKPVCVISIHGNFHD